MLAALIESMAAVMLCLLACWMLMAGIVVGWFRRRDDDRSERPD